LVAIKWFSGLRKVLPRAAAFWLSLILIDYFVVYFFGPQFWSYAGYFFGTNTRITLAVLMFVEGAVLLALGLVWASGSMEIQFQGSNLKTNPYFHKHDLKLRNEQTEKENIVGKILVLAGGPILLVSVILVTV
jgi:hypothetical protein